MGRHRVVDWSDLPPELLLEIGKRLKFRLDVLRFRSVCKSWRSSLFFKPKIEAFKIPEPPIIYDSIKRRDPPSSFILTERTMYLLHPKESEQTGHGYYKSAFGFVNWASGKLAEFEELLPNKFLPHVFSSKSSIDGFFMVKNMLDFTISPITKFYGIVLLHNKKENVEERFVKFDRFRFLTGYNGVVDKVIIVSNYNYVSIIYPIPIDCDDEDGKNVVVVALLRGGKVGLLRLLGSELTPDPVGWRVVNYGQDDEDIRFDDIVNLEGRLCVVDCKGRAFLVDLYSLELTQIALPPPNCNLEGLQLLQRRRKRLVEHSGDLYLLVTCRYKVCGGLRPHILVYKLRVQTREWVEVVSLGDQLFLWVSISLLLPLLVTSLGMWSATGTVGVVICRSHFTE
ncbi:F-box protein SKIP23-like [Chenopodium quinoa]|uniref:F-box protein SKIP23-like n=1 Tax=Chenopodium quinoa TaxID=63459 RepID=UPI000B774F3D|nr:F-box protein SKIP23-like [Chenopodium quinoa]